MRGKWDFGAFYSIRSLFGLGFRSGWVSVRFEWFNQALSKLVDFAKVKLWSVGSNWVLQSLTTSINIMTHICFRWKSFALNVKHFPICDNTEIIIELSFTLYIALHATVMSAILHKFVIFFSMLGFTFLFYIIQFTILIFISYVFVSFFGHSWTSMKISYFIFTKYSLAKYSSKVFLGCWLYRLIASNFMGINCIYSSCRFVYCYYNSLSPS